MASIDAIFRSTYPTKHLNPWPNSSASHVVNYSLLPVCPGEMEQFKDHLSSEHSWKSDKPQKQTTATAAWETFNINYACLNCWLMCTAINWWWKVYLAVYVWKPAFLRSSHQIFVVKLSLPVHYIVRQPLWVLLNFDKETFAV